MTIHLIIARHGNTFGPNDTPTRVGARTDLPLVTSGIEQARLIGRYCQENQLTPDVIYSAELLRTQQTAQHAFPEQPITPLALFNEIDYGPDENKTEQEVVKRVGKHAIEQWDAHAIVPPGWHVDPTQIIQNWRDFSAMIQQKHSGKTILVVTSNGIARFAPYLTGDFKGFCKNHSIKLKTGALGFLTQTGDTWSVDQWNIRPN